MGSLASWSARILAGIALSAAVGCTGGDEPRFHEGTPRLLAPDDAVPLSRQLKVRLDRPARIEVAISDSRGERILKFDQEKRRHLVPLLDLRAGDNVSVVVTAIDARGSAESPPVEFRTGSVPDRFPIIDVLAHDPAMAEPGLLLFSIEVVSDDESLSYLVALDDSRQPVWIWEPPNEFSDFRLHESGVMYGISRELMWAFTPLGEVLNQWGATASDDGSETYVAVDLEEPHHELYPLPHAQRFLTLAPEFITVDEFPCTAANPTASCGPAEIKDMRVIQFNRDGEILQDWLMSERVDPFRIGFNSLDVLPTGAYDWAHANAVIPRPGGGLLVSLRHQDALVALDTDGEVDWILADPAGWAPRFEPLLLAPVTDDLQWPYHQHGPAYAADGSLWIFDNGNEGATPYTARTAVDVQSRVVGYRIDESARTVTQIAELKETSTGELYSRAMGNAFLMPTTGNVMGVYATPAKEDGAANGSLGFGRYVARLVEWTTNGELASDVRLRSERSDEKQGWRTYRATQAPSLYAPGVETWLDQ